jgi:hypothetical protein
LSEVFTEGQTHGEFVAGLNGDDVATTIVGALQGGYVLSKAAGSEEPFHSAIRGVLSMLASLQSP